MIVFAVGEAEEFGGLADLVVEVDHFGAAGAEQLAKGRSRSPGEEAHSDEPPLEPQTDYPCSRATLHTVVPEFDDGVLQRGAELLPGLAAPVEGPPLKHAGVGGEQFAIVDGEMKTLPLNQLEFGGRKFLAKHVLGFRMEGAVQDFEVDFLKEWQNVAGAEFRKAAEPFVENYCCHGAGYRNRDQENKIHFFTLEIPSALR